jgi:hypothetical protein
MIVKPPRDGAPDYVKASISIKTDEFVTWIKEQLKDKPEWINIDIKSGKTGKWYAANIGDARSSGQTNLLEHGGLHFLEGNVQGAILGGTKSMLRTGAMVAGTEIGAEVIMPTNLGAQTNASAPTEREIRITHGAAKMAATIGAWLAGAKERELSFGITASATALENNHGVGARKLKGTELTVIDEEAGDGDDDIYTSKPRAQSTEADEVKVNNNANSGLPRN